MNKYIKYGLLLAIIGLLGYKSVYFEKLSTRKVASESTFDAVAFSTKLWQEQMQARLDSAVVLPVLMMAISNDSEAAFNKYTNALAIGNYRYALVKFDAKVVSVREDDILISLPVADSTIQCPLATEFIYGNAIRDASGLVQVKDYPNTTDLNNISEALNKIVRTELVPGFKKVIKEGDRVAGVAAIELNKEHIHWQGMELLPLQIAIKQ